MDRSEAIAVAEMFRIGAITVDMHGSPQKHESVSKAKEFVRESGMKCVAQQKGEHLLEVMIKRKAAKVKAEKEAAAARKKAEEEAAAAKVKKAEEEAALLEADAKKAAAIAEEEEETRIKATQQGNEAGHVGQAEAVGAGVQPE